jgi:alpha-L-fucosidase
VKISRRGVLLAGTAGLLKGAAPSPYGAVPSARQLRWHETQLNAFLHFTVNTFTGREWGLGDEEPSVFNPTAFDAGAIIAGLKAGGMKGVILTCKHHDGFCLWPTKTTEHCVKNSSWRGGKGDVVRDIADAARVAGMRFGVYLSPWDRNSATYGTPEYITLYRQQLTELLTGYGDIFEVWFDGANGGDGYYGGAREKRLIDKRTYYDWPKTWELVRSLQPNAAIFSDVGPDIRWVGNERGVAGETCWETYDPMGIDGAPPMPGFVHDKDGQTGTRNGSRWMPPECDVSIRPGWFWHAEEDGKVKTPRQLMDLYYQSVGRGGSLLLNIPPDRRGLLGNADLISLSDFGQKVSRTFAANLLARSQAKGGSKNLLDGNGSTYWSAEQKTPEIQFTMNREFSFDVIRLREAISFGQRVDAFEVDYKEDGGWVTAAKSTSIGNCRMIHLAKPIRTAEVRLRITEAAANPVLSEFGLFLEN